MITLVGAQLFRLFMYFLSYFFILVQNQNNLDKPLLAMATTSVRVFVTCSIFVDPFLLIIIKALFLVTSLFWIIDTLALQ